MAEAVHGTCPSDRERPQFAGWDRIGQRLHPYMKTIVLAVDGCDYAGLTVTSPDGKTHTATASAEPVYRGDQWQYELDEGPCLDAIATREPVIAHDLDSDDRWPGWAPRAMAELGINAMASMFLFRHRGVGSALNLYARQPHPWTQHALSVAQALAAQLADAAADISYIHDLERALDSRTVIGQAVGIVMHEFDLSANPAFDYLKRLSQDNNIKLSTIAGELVQMRRFPPVSAGGG